MQFYMTPFGVVKAAREVTEQVEVAEIAPREYRLTFPYMGTVWTMDLDRNRRPARVETTFDHPVLGSATVVARYDGYQQYQLSDIYFPVHISHTVGDREVLDLYVEHCRCVNLYVIFPVPESLPDSLAKAAASRE